MISCSCSAESSAPQLPEGENVLLEGKVTGIDRSAMVVDGDGLLFVESEKYGIVTIHIPARERICKASGLEKLSSIQTDASISVFGSVTGLHDITVCESPDHFLKEME